MQILLVGCGKMGGAMLKGWLKSGVKAAAVTVVDPEADVARVKVFKNAGKLPGAYAPDVVVLAVKPQNINDILPQLARFKNALFISIIAGKTIADLQKFLPGARVIRTMPNLPAVIGKGVVAAVVAGKLSASEKAGAVKVLKPCGKLIWFKDEADIDSVTAISGSGPAYVFLFVQALVEAGVALGLEEAVAKTLALETIIGSAALAAGSELGLGQLKVNVTSKGGTTAAALEVLEKGDALKKLIAKAAKQAKLRSIELSTN